MSNRKWANRFKLGSQSLLRLVYPLHCTVCRTQIDEPTSDDSLICDTCLKSILGEQDFCIDCGSRILTEESNYRSCTICSRKRFKFDRVYCLGAYEGPLKKSVLSAKTRSGAEVAKSLGQLLAAQLAKQIDKSEVDYLIPVPMHWTRKLLKGYNSPEVFTHSISKTLGVSAKRTMLRLVRKPRKQSELRHSSRWKNVFQAFAVKKGYDIQGANILLVDDILTSGATASELARILKGAGATTVSVAVVARAVFENVTE